MTESAVPDDRADAYGVAPDDDDRLDVPVRPLMALGIGTVLFGSAVWTWPGPTIRTLVVGGGIGLVVAGVAGVVATFRSTRGLTARMRSGAVGLVALAAGTAGLLDAATGTLILAVTVGLAWILSGVAELVLAFRTTGALKTGLLMVGVVSVGLGGWLVIRPAIALAAIVLATAASAMIIGVAEVLFALALRRTGSRP